MVPRRPTLNRAVSVAQIALILAVHQLPLDAQCVAGIPLCEDYYSFDTIVEATLVSATVVQEPVTFDSLPSVTFTRSSLVANAHVERSWKGASAGAVVIRYEHHSGSLDGRLAAGGRYVIWGHRRTDGAIEVSDCSPTAPVAQASAMIAFLDTRGRNTDGGTMFGVVMRRGTPATPVLVAGIRLTLTGPVTRTAVTDAGGQFRFTSLPAGRYSGAVEPPEGMVVISASALTFTLPDAQACHGGNVVLDVRR
jgi:hypothetical protein